MDCTMQDNPFFVADSWDLPVLGCQSSNASYLISEEIQTPRMPGSPANPASCEEDDDLHMSEGHADFLADPIPQMADPVCSIVPLASSNTPTPAPSYSSADSMIIVPDNSEQPAKKLRAASSLLHYRSIPPLGMSSASLDVSRLASAVLPAVLGHAPGTLTWAQLLEAEAKRHILARRPPHANQALHSNTAFLAGVPAVKAMAGASSSYQPTEKVTTAASPASHFFANGEVLTPTLGQLVKAQDTAALFNRVISPHGNNPAPVADSNYPAAKWPEKEAPLPAAMSGHESPVSSSLPPEELCQATSNTHPHRARSDSTGAVSVLQNAPAGSEENTVSEDTEPEGDGDSEDMDEDDDEADTQQEGAKKLKRVAKQLTKNGKRVLCLNCGAHQTPQWRCGPEGPRTLCNACGVRFKKGLPIAYWEKKKQQMRSLNVKQ